jgi:hypothetical protein
MNFIFKKKKIFLLISLIVFIIFYIILSNDIKNIDNEKKKKLDYIFTEKKVAKIEKIFFPYATIEKKINIINKLKKEKELMAKDNLSALEILYKKQMYDLPIIKINEMIKLDNNLFLTKYKINGILSGIRGYPGSGYIDFHKNNLFFVSKRGILAYRDNKNFSNNFKQIGNNINDFINYKNFQKNPEATIKDLLIFNEKIFISYTDEIKKDCYSTSVIFSEINYNKIHFKPLFVADKCVKKNDIYDNFKATETGGRIIGLDNNHIILSTGDMRFSFTSQDKTFTHGKLLKINIDNRKFNIISMGHRNPQGLYYDDKKNILLQTEHGPMGGDEINIIDLTRKDIANYGWPIASYGEHYNYKLENEIYLENINYNDKLYQKYPLYKSHKKYGFIEPIKYFVPSIGISEITKVNDEKYVVSSLRDKSIYFFTLSADNEIDNFTRISVDERVRDLIYKDNYLYLILENTGSLGIINLKDR